MSESWKAEVIADETGNWLSNALRFATQKEAIEYASNLSVQWSAVSDTRVAESNEPINSRFAGGKLEQVEQKELNNG